LTKDQLNGFITSAVKRRRDAGNVSMHMAASFMPTFDKKKLPDHFSMLLTKCNLDRKETENATAPFYENPFHYFAESFSSEVRASFH
jgi:hypothetical protein